MQSNAQPATGHTWHHGNQDLYDYVDLGGQVIVERLGLKGFTSGMPGFGEVLSEDEIWTILAFIKSTWPARLQEVQASRTRVHD
jgi:mono/diheme cytochrome c family protein